MKKTTADEPNIIDYGMMTKCPLCVNISRLGAYLLPPDEVIFFDWAVTKSAMVFNFKPFFYSQERIEKETRIKRRTLERIIKRFTAFGILEIETRMKPGNIGHSRYFNVNFAEVVKRLPELIDSTHQHYEAMQLYFIALAKFQKNPAKKDKSPTQIAKKSTAKKLIELLNSKFADRVRMYNKGELGDQDGKPNRTITPVQFERSNIIDNLLFRLSQNYDETTIRMASLAFFDWYLCNNKRSEIQSPLLYFLKYDEEAGEFPTFVNFLQEFRKHYSVKND